MTVSPTSKQLHLIQKNLARHHLYNSSIKSTLTVGVVKAIQKSLVARGYTGSISGALNSDTQKYIQLVGRRGGYTGAINSNLDSASWDGYVNALQENKLTHLSSQLAFVNTAVPVISGTSKVGQTLTASTGTWTPTADTHTRQWFKGGVLISGATGATYIPVSGDIGGLLTVTVTAHKAGYDDLSATSAATVAVVA